MGRSDPRAPRVFRIGRDRHGHWVAQDQHGLRGGVFVDRAEALRFAMSENGNCREAVVVVSDVMEARLGHTACRTAPGGGNDGIEAHRLSSPKIAPRRRETAQARGGSTCAVGRAKA